MSRNTLLQAGLLSLAGGVHNHGQSAARLLGADAPVAGRWEIHRSTLKDGDDEHDAGAVGGDSAGDAARCEPLGCHVMLPELKQHPHDGEGFPMTLPFEKAGDLQVQVAVQKNAPGGHDGKGHARQGMGKQ